MCPDCELASFRAFRRILLRTSERERGEALYSVNKLGSETQSDLERNVTENNSLWESNKPRARDGTLLPFRIDHFGFSASGFVCASVLFCSLPCACFRTTERYTKQ